MKHPTLAAAMMKEKAEESDPGQRACRQ